MLNQRMLKQTILIAVPINERIGTEDEKSEDEKESWSEDERESRSEDENDSGSEDEKESGSEDEKESGSEDEKENGSEDEKECGSEHEETMVLHVVNMSAFLYLSGQPYHPIDVSKSEHVYPRKSKHSANKMPYCRCIQSNW